MSEKLHLASHNESQLSAKNYRLVDQAVLRADRVKQLEQHNDYYRNYRNRLLTSLQTTLELEEVLRLFFQNMQELLGIAQLNYVNDPQAATIEFGDTARHSANYSLNISQQYLGELTVTRRERFLEQELTVLEYLLGTLIYPLRNALMYREAIRSAHTDPLTGLGSRSAMINALEREFGIAHRNQWPLSMLVVDIDFFKKINDSFGHSAGDAVLKQVASAVKECLRCSDQSFRYGGEEFVVILSKTDEAQAQVIAERIRVAIEQLEMDYNGKVIKATASIGITEARDVDDSLSLFNRADKALYSAKHNGRNQVSCA